MALSKSSLPAILPTIATPFDFAQAFSESQPITASGYLTNLNLTLNLGPGRFDGLWVLNVTACLLTSDQTYRVLLLGSNDLGFGNGNVDVLSIWDAAAVTAGRILATICAATPSIPGPGTLATRIVRPFLTEVGDFVFAYQRCYAILGGTTPSMIVSSWICPNTMRDARRQRALRGLA